MEKLRIHSNLLTKASLGPSIILIRSEHKDTPGCPCVVIDVEDDTFYPFDTIDKPLKFNLYEAIPQNERDATLLRKGGGASKEMILAINDFFK